MQVNSRNVFDLVSNFSLPSEFSKSNQLITAVAFAVLFVVCAARCVMHKLKNRINSQNNSRNILRNTPIDSNSTVYGNSLRINNYGSSSTTTTTTTTIENTATNVNTLDSLRRTALLRAITKGNVETVKKLLEEGANPDIPGQLAPSLNLAIPYEESGITEEQVKIIELLVEHRASLNPGNQHFSPLFQMARQHYLCPSDSTKKLLALLIEKGAILLEDEKKEAAAKPIINTK